MSISFETVFTQVKTQIGKMRTIPIGKISRRDCERFAMAVDDQNPLYFDDTFAREHGYPGAIAPPTYLSAVLGWESGPPESSLRPDGTPQNDAMAVPIRGLRVMGGGQELEFHNPIVAGMDLVMEFGISNAELKQGRTGPLIVIQIEKKYLTTDGVLVLVCRENAIAR